MGRLYYIEHSAKGSTWEDHMYVKRIDGKYYYASGYENGRTVDSLKPDSASSGSSSSKSNLSGLKANNELDQTALDVIRGKYGNGAERRKALGDRYEEIQARVNQIMKDPSVLNSKSEESSESSSSSSKSSSDSSEGKEETATEESTSKKSSTKKSSSSSKKKSEDTEDEEEELTPEEQEKKREEEEKQKKFNEAIEAALSGVGESSDLMKEAVDESVEKAVKKAVDKAVQAMIEGNTSSSAFLDAAIAKIGDESFLTTVIEKSVKKLINKAVSSAVVTDTDKDKDKEVKS